MIPRMVSSPLVSGDEWTDCYDHMKNSIIEDSDDEPLFPDEEEEDNEVDGGDSEQRHHLSRGRTRTNSSSGLSSTSSNSTSSTPPPPPLPPMMMMTQEVVDITCGSRPRMGRKTRRRKSGRRRSSGRGAVAKTLLGPAGILMGGRQEWSKMKQYIRRLAAAQDPRNKSAIHNSELV